RPIGVFDSGLGGLTAVRELFRVLPHESVVYFGDTARLPYGSKSRETVTHFSLEIAAFLLRQNIKCLLVACNTASSYALDTLAARLEIPVTGVIEPAARAAVAASPHGRIGVIGTYGTVGSGAYAAAIGREAPGAAVIARACPLFVPLIEEGWIDHPVTRQVADEYLLELRNAGLESMILGCTHYPLIAPLIAGLMGPAVTLVDSGAEAARAVATMLHERGQLAPAGDAQQRFYLSDEPRNFTRIAQGFLGRALPPPTIVDETDVSWFERTHPDSALGTKGGRP
ncbi:MAG: glutamate racemase, partial [Candidatus Eisenbacteria bacterium]